MDLLPPSFTRLHYLQLDLDSNDNSKAFACNLKNHFNTVVGHAEGRIVGDEESENSYMEIFVFETETSRTRNKSRSSSSSSPPTTPVKSPQLFSLTIHKILADEDSSSGDNANTSAWLNCELHSSKGQTLGHIYVTKDARASVYSYNLLDGNKENSSLQISRAEKDGAKDKPNVLVNINSLVNGETRTIARIDLEDKNSFSLSMTPELNAFSKIRAISILVLMEIVENMEEQ